MARAVVEEVRCWRRYLVVAVIEDRLDAIRGACERFHVARLDVFGSALRDDFEPGRSDIDFLVDFGPMLPSEKPDAYFGLLDELRAILGSEVDLVMVGALKNRYLRDDVNRTKQQLYAA
jgi:predicted nucleotidyltransferase